MFFVIFIYCLTLVCILAFIYSVWGSDFTSGHGTKLCLDFLWTTPLIAYGGWLTSMPGLRTLTWGFLVSISLIRNLCMVLSSTVPCTWGPLPAIQEWPLKLQPFRLVVLIPFAVAFKICSLVWSCFLFLAYKFWFFFLFFSLTFYTKKFCIF